jgi:ERCC4-related helicase
MAGKRLLKNSDALQQDIKPIMSRTLRRETGIHFARRDAKLVKITTFKYEEAALYDELLSLLRGVYRRHMGPAAKISQASGLLQYVSQFVLIAMLVLREMASHPMAALLTLKTALRKRVEEFAFITHDDSDLAKLDAFIKRYTGQSWDVAHHAKSERLLKEARRLFAEGKKFVIYVNYLKTLNELSKLLAKQNPTARVLSYEGSMGHTEKTEVMSLFKDEPKACLVSTDSGGQGSHMEFSSGCPCHIVNQAGNLLIKFFVT